MRLALALSAAAAGLAVAGAALACSCVPYRSAAEQLAATDLMFRGRVVSASTTGEGAAVTSFRVLEVIKGRASGTLRVRHRLDGASCGVRFRPGATVLVLAHRGNHGAWRTGLCSAPRFPEADYRRAARGEPVPVKPPEM